MIAKIEILKDASGSFAILETLYNSEDEGKSPFEKKGVHSFVSTIKLKREITIIFKHSNDNMPIYFHSFLFKPKGSHLANQATLV